MRKHPAQAHYSSFSATPGEKVGKGARIPGPCKYITATQAKGANSWSQLIIDQNITGLKSRWIRARSSNNNCDSCCIKLWWCGMSCATGFQDLIKWPMFKPVCSNFKKRYMTGMIKAHKIRGANRREGKGSESKVSGANRRDGERIEGKDRKSVV
jgi:hypothetical protein